MCDRYVINKYCINSSSNLNLPFEEIMEDFKNIKPSKVPILDISLLSMLGKYIHNYTVINKWGSAPYLLQEIISSVKTKYNNLTKSIEEKSETLEYEMNEAIKLLEAPDSYKFEERLLKIILDIYKENVNYFNKFDKKHIQDLLTFKYEIVDIIKKCISKYEFTWNEFEDKIVNIEEIIMINFEDLESNQDFQDTISIIENVTKNTENKINKLIINTIELIKSTKLLTKDFNNKLESIYMFEKLKKHIIKNFNTEMDKIYYEEIMSHKFNSEISMALLEMYEVEKSMYRLALTFSELENDLKNLN
jgi:hypothetical protein